MNNDNNDISNKNDDNKQPPKVRIRTTLKARPASSSTAYENQSLARNFQHQFSYSPTTIYASSSQLHQSPIASVLRPDIHEQVNNLLVNTTFQRPRSTLEFSDKENFNYFPIERSSELISSQNDRLRNSKSDYSLNNNQASRYSSPASRLESIKKRKQLDYLNNQRFSQSNNQYSSIIPNNIYLPVLRSRSHHATTQTDAHLDPFVSTKTGCLPDFAETETASFYYNEDPIVTSHISRILTNSVLTSSSPCLAYVFDNLEVVETGSKSLQRSPQRSPNPTDDKKSYPTYRTVSTSMESLIRSQSKKIDEHKSTQTSPEFNRRNYSDNKQRMNTIDAITSPTSDSESSGQHPEQLARTKTTTIYEKVNPDSSISIKESFSIKNRKNKNIQYTQKSEYQEVVDQSSNKQTVNIFFLFFDLFRLYAFSFKK